MRMALDRGDIGIDPLDPALVQPASIDLRLGDSFRIMHPAPPAERLQAGSVHYGAIDTRAMTDETYPLKPGADGRLLIAPGDFILANTLERIKVPDYLAAKVEGKSSLGRIGLLLHATAGFIDPGFEGTVTLELSVVAPRPLVLYTGMKIGQICFFVLTNPAVRPYGSEGLGSKYQGQQEATVSRYAG